MMRMPLGLVAALVGTMLIAAPRCSALAAEAMPVFETDVQPILQAHCARCHGQQVTKGELRLTSLNGVMKGSVSGAVVEPGNPEESLLYEVLHKGAMPGDGKNPPSEEEIATIRRWIATGAKTKTGKAVVQKERLNQHDVLPILYTRCTVCHGRESQKAGLDLRSRKGMLDGGKSGPAIVPGKPEESLLVQKIRAGEMPPPKKLVDFGVRPVQPPELETIVDWIAAGAPKADIEPDVATTGPDPLVTDEDRDFWSFQPPQRPEIPTVEHQQRLRNPLDAFILRRLEKKRLSLAPEADKLTLIRRVAFDLTGLPPSWSQVQRFLEDDRPGAYRRMVDRFLSSPAYGERWGRYWLDLAGYADSEGKRSADPIRPHAWRYRDYVIRSFNEDKPYDQFLLEQIAGDELVNYKDAETITPEMEEKLVATGFLRMAPDGTGSDIVNTVAERFEVIRDEIDILGDTVLGLTIKCAQCHSHKYDPIPQRDYYRLVAVFKGAYDQYDWLKPSFVPGQTKANSPGRVLPFVNHKERQAWKSEKQEIEAQIADLKQQRQAKRRTTIEKLQAERIAQLPEKLHEKLRRLLETPKKQRTKAQKQLAAKYEEKLAIDPKQVPKLDKDFKKFAQQTEKKIKKLQNNIPKEPLIRALWDRGHPSPTYIYRRGEHTKPGRLVGPGVPSVLTDGRSPFQVEQPWSGAEKTGRRLAFAKWLIEEDHPLTARVMVNRLWEHHFGKGLVETTDNFGHTGARPTHPALLDWLAREFIARDWSMKEMHRLMLTSSTYRQVSRLTDRRQRHDPQNKLLSRMPLKRMDAEVVRDSLLGVAGELNQRRFGEPDPVKVRDDGLVTSKELPDGGWRRSIYVRQRRKAIPTILQNFNLPQMIPNCVDRPESTVASQALHLMNNEMVRKLARSFAERVQREVGHKTERQVERVYQVALSRWPTEQERRLSVATLDQLKQKWHEELKPEQKHEADRRALSNYCHTVVNSAAFLYID